MKILSKNMLADCFVRAKRKMKKIEAGANLGLTDIKADIIDRTALAIWDEIDKTEKKKKKKKK